MKPKIGIKTRNIMKTIDGGIGLDVVELISNDLGVGFNARRIAQLKELFVGKDLSMHSQAGQVFASTSEFGVPEFMEAELTILRAEIILCKTLGAKELIFHMKPGKLSGSEIESIRKLLDFAKDNGVEMIYESNWGFVAKDTLAVLEEFPDLNYNLDLGHLNISLGRDTLGMSAEDFISEIKNRVVYIHAHNNDGNTDLHRGIADGTLDWKKILGLLDFTHIRKVMAEVWDTEALVETKKELEEYFDE